jgi:hypothetical protein
MFCIYLTINSDLCHLQHLLIGFYNRDEKCLQRGTDWVLKLSGLRFVFKGLNSIVYTAGYTWRSRRAGHNCATLAFYGSNRCATTASHYSGQAENAPIHNILSTAPQFSICQKALGTLPEDGNVMPKHVGAIIHN